MKLYNLLNNEGFKLENDEIDLIKELYKDKGTTKHFIFKNAPDILLFLKKYNIKIFDEETNSKIFKENFKNDEDSEKIFHCDLFRTDEEEPTFNLYFKINHLYNFRNLWDINGCTYQIKHISFK